MDVDDDALIELTGVEQAKQQARERRRQRQLVQASIEQARKRRRLGKDRVETSITTIPRVDGTITRVTTTTITNTATPTTQPGAFTNNARFEMEKQQQRQQGLIDDGQVFVDEALEELERLEEIRERNFEPFVEVDLEKDMTEEEILIERRFQQGLRRTHTDENFIRDATLGSTELSTMGGFRERRAERERRRENTIRLTNDFRVNFNQAPI